MLRASIAARTDELDSSLTLQICVDVDGMATNFTVILSEIRHVGNQPDVFDDVEPGVPFAGPISEMSFDCPRIDSAETALLMFQSRDIDHQKNVMLVNGIEVARGLPATPARDTWNSNVVLIEPRHALRGAANVLRVESRDASGASAADVDDFLIGNVVIVYKAPDVVWTLPVACGDLAAFLENELLASIPNVRGSGAGANREDQRNEYVLPTPAQLAGWRAVFRSLLAGAWGTAHAQARAISATYNVVQFLDTASGRTYHVVMEGVPGQIPAAVAHAAGISIVDPADPTRRGWGTYVFGQGPQRALSLSAPHHNDDAGTAEQAVEAYLALRARTLLIAGTDRDQNVAAAPCAQSQRRYLEADVSHTAESVFQMAFEEIYASDAVTWHLQFHGNASCPNDVFLSNAVVPAPTTLHALAANIEAASKAAAQGGPTLAADVFDADDDCEARGTDNMQMRFASGLPHASICPEASVPAGPSRFIHVEQSRIARRAAGDPQATRGRNRAVIVAGIQATFP